MEEGSTFKSGAQTQEIYLNVYRWSNPDYHTIDIQTGKGRWIRNLIQDGPLVLFKSTGTPSAADLNFPLPG